jgi:hypothetical protein
MNQRPISTLIFGILNIGFGVLKLGGPLVSAAIARLKLSPGHSGLAALQSDPAFVALQKLNMWAGAVLGLALLAFGIGLLLLQNWARLGSIVYAVIDIVLVLVMSMVMWPLTKRMMEQMPGVPPGMMAAFATVGLVFGLIFGLAYPVLLLFFMTRSNVIEACERPQPATPA